MDTKKPYTHNRPPRDGERRPSRFEGDTRPPREGERRPSRVAGDTRPPREGERRPSRAGHTPPEQGGEVAFEERPNSLTEALIALDLGLMKTLVQRTKLVSRLRGGKQHAASPRAIQDEKAVRTAWENNALGFSKDPRFSRELFALLQDLTMLSKNEAQDADGYIIAPALQPLQADITGPTCALSAKLFLALAAMQGQQMTLGPLLFSDDLADFVTALTRSGAVINKEQTGAFMHTLEVAAGAPAAFANQTLLVGESFFSLYLLAFLAAGNVGTLRFNGDAPLKNADLAGLRATLPLLGARLAHVVPRSKGLPANLECSGMVPNHIAVPAELSFEGVCALIVAATVWNTAQQLDFSALPAASAAAALATVQPLLAGCGANLEFSGATLIIAPAALAVPVAPPLPLDAAFCGYLLAMPLFAGGSVTLKGLWPAHLAQSADARALLAWAGLGVQENSGSITASTMNSAFTTALHGINLEGNLLPLYVVLAAKAQQLANTAFTLPYALEGEALALANELYTRLGLECDGATVHRPALAQTGAEQTPAHTRPWASPSPHWSMAFALTAFMRPGLRLVNPASVTAAMPPYWNIMNSLPTPFDPATPSSKPKHVEATPPARRRVIAE